MAQESLALTAALNKPAEIDCYNNRIYEKIEEMLWHRVLEVGSGRYKIAQILCCIGKVRFFSFPAAFKRLVSGCLLKRHYIPTESAGIGNRLYLCPNLSV
jgi:hypothetical protein